MKPRTKTLSIIGVRDKDHEELSRVNNALGSLSDQILVQLDSDKYKFGSLDSMLLNYERITKTDRRLESFMKKIHKHYSELEPELQLADQHLETKD